MSKRIFKLMCVIMALGFTTARAQTGTISGKVTNKDGQPIPQVNINIKEIKRNAVTDESGHYQINNIPVGTYTLSSSHVGSGIKKNIITVNENEAATFDIVLPVNNQSLQEVVIVSTKSINKGVATIGKSNIPIMDLPQSAVVLGEGLIKTQQAQRLSDVVKNVNGVYLGTTRGSTQESFYARGYSFGNNNIFKNGFRVNSGAMPEMSSIQSVEILKGSAAILYGNVAPGGILNMVTKKPKFNFGGEVSMRTGSFDLYKPAIDVYGPISNTVAYRLNGTFESAGSYRDVVASKRYYFNPSFLFKLGAKTELLVQGDYLKHEFTPDFGIGSLADTVIAQVPRSRFMGATWQYSKTQQATASTYLNHAFSDNWNLSVGLSYQNYGRDYFSTERIQARANGDWYRPLGKTDTKENYYTAQANITGKFATGFIKHNFLGGIDADKYNTTQYAANFPGTTRNIYDTINLLDPAKYTARTDVPNWQWDRKITTPSERFGIYVQDLLTLSDKFKFLAGVRWSWLQNSPIETVYLQKNDSTAKAATKVEQAFTPRFGLVYQPTKNMSLFASYANSFSQNNGFDINNQPLEPSFIDQYEVGIKNILLNGKLNANLTLYRIVNSNLSQPDPNAGAGTNVRILSGETTSKGVEVDLKYVPVNGFDLIAGYSYNDMRYTKTSGNAGSFYEGDRLVNTPAHTANATAFYTFTTVAKGLKLGFGAYYVGDRWGGWNNTVGQTQINRMIKIKAFTTLDATVGYCYKKVSLLAKLGNIGNVYNYYVHENYSINPIPPRNFTATLAYSF